MDPLMDLLANLNPKIAARIKQLKNQKRRTYNEKRELTVLERYVSILDGINGRFLVAMEINRLTNLADNNYKK